MSPRCEVQSTDATENKLNFLPFGESVCKNWIRIHTLKRRIVINDVSKPSFLLLVELDVRDKYTAPMIPNGDEHSSTLPSWFFDSQLNFVIHDESVPVRI